MDIEKWLELGEMLKFVARINMKIVESLWKIVQVGEKHKESYKRLR